MNAKNNSNEGEVRWGICAVAAIAASIATCCLIGGRATAAEEGKRPTKQSDYPQAPQELVKQYIQAVKDTPLYKAFKAMNPAVRAKVPEWEERTGLTMRIATDPFLDVILYHNISNVTLPDGRQATLKRQARSRGDRGRSLLIHCGSKGEAGSSYPVEEDRLAEINFECVDRVEIIDPGNKPLETFSVQNKNISSIIRELCELGKLGYSFREDLAKKAYVSMKLHNKSIAECLNLAAMTSGWKITFHKGRYSSERLRDTHVNFDEWLVDMTRAAGPAQDPPVQKRALARLEARVLEASDQAKKDRPVVTLSPAGGAASQ